MFVCDARHAFRGRGSERGVRGVHGKPSTGRGRILEKSHDPNPAEIILLGATDNLLKIETLAKMHQNYHFYFLFFSVHVLLFCLYFVIVCTTCPGLQGHPISFSNHFHLSGFNVQVLFLNVLFYFLLL